MICYGTLHPEYVVYRRVQCSITGYLWVRGNPFCGQSSPGWLMRRKYRPFSVQRFKHLVYSKISTITPRVTCFTLWPYSFMISPGDPPGNHQPIRDHLQIPPLRLVEPLQWPGDQIPSVPRVGQLS